MLLSAEHLSINFGSRQLLEDVNFYLNEGDKIGVIGINGTGKSTFLKVLAGRLEADAGTISRNPNVQVSLLEQNPPMEDDATVLEQVFLHFPKEFRELNEYEAKSMLNRLGLPDYEQKVGTLSGGQRKRVALASALVIPIAGKADLRLLGIAFGVFFILLALYFMFVQKNLKVSASPLTGAVCGLISGALSGLFSIGAPTMALYFRGITKDRDHYFADLQTTLAVSNVISTSVRIQQGLYTPELVPPTVIGFFGILLGQYLGVK